MFQKTREWMNRNSVVATTGAIVLLGVSIAVIVRTVIRPPNPPRVVDVYYLDLDTSRIFVARSDQIPPIETMPGAAMPMGVRAFLFACGQCPVDLKGFTPEQLRSEGVHIGWVEMYTPEAKDWMQRVASGQAGPEGPDGMLDQGGIDAWEQGRLIARFAHPGDRMKWVPANSEPGFQIMRALQDLCDSDGEVKACFPPQS